MPASVLTVSIFVGVFIVFYVVSFNFSHAAIAVMIMIGMIRGHALAWQWGRIIPIIGGVAALLGLTVLMDPGVEPLEGAIILAVSLPMMAMMFSIPFLLGTKRARLFFRLSCPSCSSMKVKAASFFFTTRSCKECGTTFS